MGDFFTLVSLIAFVVTIVLGVRIARGSTAWTRRSRKWLAGSAGTWLVAFLLSFIAWGPQTANAAPSAFDSQPQMSVAGYQQTWPKGYADTSCEEFSDDMTASQRFAAAADMLTLVWMKIETSDRTPSDTLILQYQDAIADDCGYPEQKIVEAAWAAWIRDARFSA